MSKQANLATAPDQLVQPRALSHAAVQWPSRAPRANLSPVADDSHSNLGWTEWVYGLVSHFWDPDQQCQLGFGFSTGSLLWLVGREVADSLKLEHVDEPAAKGWCDAHLLEFGLKTTDHAEMPYYLAPVDYADLADTKPAMALRTLGAWYSQAQIVLDDLVVEFGGMAVTQRTVRCWPHHYYLATLFVLEQGHPKMVRSIGLGLSPDDASYGEPYFYCTPWPTPKALPEAPGPLDWHTEGLTALVFPGRRILQQPNVGRALSVAVRLVHEMLH